MNQKESKFMQICGELSLAMMALYFVDIIMLGTGAMTRIGPVSSRIVLFALSVFFAIPLMLHRIKGLIRNPYLIAVAAFAVWLAVSAIRGYLAGNPRHILIADVKGYMNYAILPAMLCVLDRRERIHKLMKTIVFACFAMAVISVVMSFYTYFPNGGAIYAFCDRFGLCGITKLFRRAVRVFFHTASRYFFVGYLFALYFYCRETSRGWKMFWMSAMTLFLFGIFSSYSRGIYASAVLGVVAVLALQFCLPAGDRKKLTAAMLLSAGCVVVFLVVLSLIQKTNLIAVALERVLEIKGILGEDWTDVLEGLDESKLTVEELANAGLTRQYELNLLAKSIAANPIFGNGLGKNIPPYDFVEYSYHDVMNKAGAIGLVLMFAPFVTMIAEILRQKKSRVVTDCSAWLLRLFALVSAGYFLFIAYSNPCMNTTVGISCYCLCMTLVTHSMKQSQT